MNPRYPWLDQHLGARGYTLITCGSAWCIDGASILSDQRFATIPAVRILTQVVPIQWWAWMWIVCGAVAILSSPLHAHRDNLGFAAAALPPATWAVTYTIGWIDGSFPLGWAIIPSWSVPLALLAIVAELSARHATLIRRVRELEREVAGGRH